MLAMTTANVRKGELLLISLRIGNICSLSAGLQKSRGGKEVYPDILMTCVCEHDEREAAESWHDPLPLEHVDVSSLWNRIALRKMCHNQYH